jgi:hypothetical protein
MASINIDGDVSLNGKLCYRGLNPKVGGFGFRLWRLDENRPEMVRTHGPHINLSLPTPSVFQNVSKEAFLISAIFSFSGPYLGSMDELIGIPALHEGAKTRIIDKIDLKATLKDGKLTLLLSGTAKPFPGTPGKPIGPNNLLEPQEFGICCPIPLSAIPSVFEGRSGFFLQKKLECESMKEYLEAVKYGPPKDIG